MNSDPQLLTIDQNAAGTRLDSFLAALLGDISRTKVQRAIEKGDILVNDRQAKSSYRLRAGDSIEIDLEEASVAGLVPDPIPINILYEDDDMVVVDKAAGMVVHPGAGNQSGTLANALAYHFSQLSAASGALRPGIVHRLDKETSGLLVVAKNDSAHEHLADQFRLRTVVKMYIALVYGRVSSDEGEIAARIGRSRQNRTRMTVLKGGAGREALTRFVVTERYQEFTLVDVRIKTGRTHQIRVHMAHIGHPVVGDAVYGKGRDDQIRNHAIRQKARTLGRHFLHSAQLSFDHPRTGRRMEFASPLPPELAELLSLLA